MIFQLFEAEALMGAMIMLMYLGAVALALILLGIGFLLLRRMTKQERKSRRRVFTVLALFFLVPGVLIPIAALVFFAVTSLWLYPKIDKAWDFSTSRSMAQFGPSECSVREDSLGMEHRCIYQGNISISIELPEGRQMSEKAELVWVDGKENQITKIMMFSKRYETDEMHTKVEELIKEWKFDAQKYHDWRHSEKEGAEKPLYYWRDDASPGKPRLWLKVKRLEDEETRPWFMQMDLHWD